MASVHNLPRKCAFCNVSATRFILDGGPELGIDSQLRRQYYRRVAGQPLARGITSAHAQPPDFEFLTLESRLLFRPTYAINEGNILHHCWWHEKSFTMPLDQFPRRWS